MSALQYDPCTDIKLFILSKMRFCNFNFIIKFYFVMFWYLRRMIICCCFIFVVYFLHEKENWFNAAHTKKLNHVIVLFIEKEKRKSNKWFDARLTRYYWVLYEYEYYAAWKFVFCCVLLKVLFEWMWEWWMNERVNH